MTFGGVMLTLDRSKFLAPSNPVMSVSYGFAYKEDDVSIMNVSLNILTDPFQSNLWLILFLISSIATFLILSTKRLTRKWRHFYIGGRVNRSPILNMWIVVLGKGIANTRIANGQKIGTFARFLLIMSILFWFVVRSCYEGVLFSNFSNNRIESPYDTIKKVYQSKCKILIQPIAYAHMTNMMLKPTAYGNLSNVLTKDR